MRVLSFLFSTFLILGLVGGAVFLGGRELWLQYAVMQLADEQVTLRRWWQNKGQHFETCRNQGYRDFENQVPVAYYQLRFTSPSEYVLEVVCNQVQNRPVELASRELPLMVTKLSGQTGFVYGVETEIELKFFGRVREFENEQNELVLVGQTLTVPDAPAASCVGLGYQCCDRITQQGQLPVTQQVIDCSGECFQRCLPRPTILSFTTNPVMDALQRRLTVGNNQLLTFSYVAEPPNEDSILTGRIEVAGQQLSVNGQRGQVDFVATCTRPQPCEYMVNLTLSDDQGVPSVSSAVSQLVLTVLP